MIGKPSNIKPDLIPAFFVGNVPNHVSIQNEFLTKKNVFFQIPHSTIDADIIKNTISFLKKINRYFLNSLIFYPTLL